jgi:hypothetical protein
LEERFEIATLWSAFFGMSTVQPSAMQWWVDGVEASGLRTRDGQMEESRRWSR